MSATVSPPTSLVQVVPHPGEAPSGVISAIVGVMSRIKEIAKAGTNTKDNYKFVYYGDLLAAVQQAMVDEGLVVTQRQINMKVQDKVLMILYTFDAYHKDGTCIYNIMSHTGACRFEFKSGATDDKAVSKCLQSAQKYGLLSLFKIPPDDAIFNEPVSDGDADEQGINEDPGERSRRRNGNGNGDRRRDDDRDRRVDLPDERGADRAVRRDPPPDDDAALGDLPASPPPDPSPDERDFQDRVRAFKRKLGAAQNERDAGLLWEDDKQLVKELSDTTYAFLREEYHSRWNVYPPAV